jgi:hypothetical protein
VHDSGEFHIAHDDVINFSIIEIVNIVNAITILISAMIHWRREVLLFPIVVRYMYSDLCLFGPEELYRSDFFPGLGWMLTKSFWEELEPKWPHAYPHTIFVAFYLLFSIASSPFISLML